MTQLKVACIQPTSGADIAANIDAVGTMVAQAAEAGAEFVALPENVFYMREAGAQYTPEGYSETTHPGIAAAKRWAAHYRIWLLIGSVAVASENTEEKRQYNRSLMINPHGDIIAAYDKIHLFDVDVADGQHYRESERILAGEKSVLADTPWGYMGLSICYDLRFPHLYRALAKAGAKILTVPSAFTAITGEAHWHVLLRARAIENACFVIAPAQCGTHPGGRKTYGHSLIVDPWGRVLADGGDAPGIVMAEIDVEEVARVRAKLPSLEHDREFLSC